MSYSHERVRELLMDDDMVVHIKNNDEFKQFCDIVDESGRVLDIESLYIFDRDTDLKLWDHFGYHMLNVCGTLNYKAGDVISFKEFLVHIYADFDDDNSDLEIDSEIF